MKNNIREKSILELHNTTYCLTRQRRGFDDEIVYRNFRIIRCVFVQMSAEIQKTFQLEFDRQIVMRYVLFRRCGVLGDDLTNSGRLHVLERASSTRERHGWCSSSSSTSSRRRGGESDRILQCLQYIIAKYLWSNARVLQ